MTNDQDFLSQLSWRYATKKFDPSKKLLPEQLHLIEESLRLAPSSFGFQPWRFYRIENKEVRQEIKKAGNNQSQMTDASHLFVLASKLDLSAGDVEEYVSDMAKTRGIDESIVAETKKWMVGFVAGKSKEWLNEWSARQMYIALGFGLMAAAQNNIDACPMEGFDPEAVGNIIGAKKDGYQARAMLALGFRSQDDPAALVKKVRFPKEKVIKII